MAQLIAWDEPGERRYELGVDRGVFYPQDSNTGNYDVGGVPWNGLVSVAEKPSGAETTKKYADNIAYANVISLETLGGTIEAFTYPDEFAAVDGSAEAVTGVMVGQQARVPFGMCYRTKLANDIEGQAHGYRLHLIYGMTVTPSERSYETINESPEPITFSWEFNTTPVSVTDLLPTASIIIDSTKVAALDLAALEVILYGATGTPDVAGRLPLPDEVITLLTP
jgi:hypothetical protein